jgi:ABC-type enterochelin transport system ATPase subunit
MSFAASDVDSFVAKHGWLLLKFSGRALSVDSVGENQKKFIASVIAQMTDTSFMDTRKSFAVVSRGNGLQRTSL